MKKTLFFAAALALTAGSALAQPTLTHLQTVQIGGTIATPTGVAVVGGNAYAVSFGGTDKIIAEIADVVTASPTVSVFSTLSAADPAFASGRGLSTIEVLSNGNFLAAGDTGSDGGIFEVSSVDGSLVAQDDNAIGGNSHRYAAAREWGGSGNILATQRGSGLFNLQSDLTAFTAGSFVASSKSFMSDIRVLGNDLFGTISANQFASNDANDGIYRFTGGTSGDLTGYSDTLWYDYGAQTTRAAAPLFIYAHSAATYVVAVNTTNDDIVFLDSATAMNPTPAETLSDATNIGDAFGIWAGEINGSEYLIVTGTDATSASAIIVYGIDGATLQAANVEGWDLY